MRYRLIAIDIDGTLMNDQYEIPRRTIETINQVLSKCHVVLCTGRALFSTKPLLEHFSRPLPLITDNGGTVWLPEKGIVEQYTLERDVVRELLWFSRRHGLHIDFTTGDGIYVEHLNGDLAAVYRKYFAVPTQLDDLLQLEQLPVKITMSGLPEQIDEAFVLVERQFAGTAQFFRSGPHFIDFIALGVNKGTALRKLASKLGVDMAETIAFGNYFNDVEMLRMSGLGVAVANAPEEVKRQADLVTDSNNDEGVRKVLEKYVLDLVEQGEESCKKMSGDLTVKEMQRIVDEYIGQFKVGYFSPLAMMARLSEEVGELAREINHRFGEKPKKPDEPENSIEMELADCMFILVCFANSLGIDLEKAFYDMMEKFTVRDAGRWELK